MQDPHLVPLTSGETRRLSLHLGAPRFQLPQPRQLVELEVVLSRSLDVDRVSVGNHSDGVVKSVGDASNLMLPGGQAGEAKSFGGQLRLCREDALVLSRVVGELLRGVVVCGMFPRERRSMGRGLLDGACHRELLLGGSSPRILVLLSQQLPLARLFHPTCNYKVARDHLL